MADRSSADKGVRITHSLSGCGRSLRIPAERGVLTLSNSSNKTADRLKKGLAFERPLLDMEQKIQELRNLAVNTHLDLNGEVVKLQERLESQTTEVYSGPGTMSLLQFFGSCMRAKIKSSSWM